MEKVKSYVKLAREEGATVYQLEMPTLPETNNGGFFMAPVIVTDVSASSRLLKEEIFGPIVCIVPFDTEHEAIELANATDYGLAASVWASDAARLQRCAAKINVGIVWCNCWLVRDVTMPFGGFKNSGIGRLGNDAFDFFTEKKTVYMKM